MEQGDVFTIAGVGEDKKGRTVVSERLSPNIPFIGYLASGSKAKAVKLKRYKVK